MNGIHYGEASVSSLEPKDYQLHRAAFENDVGEMKRLLQEGSMNIAKRNAAGDTALHVAAMLGHKEIVHLLLEAGAPVKIKNNNGWNSLVEAISYGSRDIITEMFAAARTQAREALSERKPHLLKMLNDLRDFSMEFKWVFHSWIPLLSKVLPSDICRIYKRGCALRMDSSLLDLNDKSLERGNISFLFNPDLPTEKQFVVLDNNAKTYQRMKQSKRPAEIDEEINVMMSSDIVDMSMSTKPITFSRAKSGWIFRQERTEDVCGFESEFFDVQHLNLVTRKRREHLSAEDVKKNKSIMQKLTSGNIEHEEDMEWSEHRRSLQPPPRPLITFEEYITSIDPIPLGRTPQIKTNTKKISAMVAMSKDFPLSVEMLIEILEVLAPTKHMHKLKKFCQSKLPEGFPVKLEIPIFATITATITFQQFEWRDDLTERMFLIPRSYKEDSSKFPDF